MLPLWCTSWGIRVKERAIWVLWSRTWSLLFTHRSDLVSVRTSCLISRSMICLPPAIVYSSGFSPCPHGHVWTPRKATAQNNQISRPIWIAHLRLTTIWRMLLTTPWGYVPQIRALFCLYFPGKLFYYAWPAVVLNDCPAWSITFFWCEVIQITV